ncbi:MAG TPA: succinylglutamate desuccinylase/aspartoacylase family protein, partial [Armatimonadota bacterium]|nr:succinylglutamate desuccinylase/aspartoacylase family protein [Armatimonadota bacterium]
MAKTHTFQLKWDTGEGQTVPVFVRELTGEGGGPVLALIGGEHGNEVTGPAAIDLLCQDLETTPFRGTVLAVPI